MSNNFFDALHQIASERGISRDEIEEIVESAMMSAYKKQYGATDNVEVVFNRDDNSVMLVSKKLVVKKPINPSEEISYDKAVKIQPDVQPGDEIRVEENPFDTFGRIAAQTAKQVIIQKIKESEKNVIYNEYKDKEGELINGYLQRRARDVMYVDLGKAEGILPAREQSPLEHYKTGDRIKALILRVEKSSKSSGIILSRASHAFIEKLFEMEVPEIYDGVVKIVRVVRETGMRTKVAVTSERDDVDSVGACVGMRGVRIQSIVRELEGEKIDVVEWSDDRKIMTENAIVPAKAKEIIEQADGGVIVIVEKDQYAVAVGKNGHNVRLASALCGFNIDIKTEDSYREYLDAMRINLKADAEKLFRENPDETPLTDLPGLDPKTISLLEAGGIFSVEELVEKYESLEDIEGIGEKTAQRIQEIIDENIDFDYNDEESGDEEETEQESGNGSADEQ